MNLSKFILLSFYLLITVNIFGQYEFKDYKFSDEKIEVPENYTSENEIVLLRNIKTELLTKENAVLQFYLLHEKILINSANAIERNNKVYIPFRTEEKLLVNKLRVIQNNGKIIELKTSDVKEETNEETGVKYQYYAVTGLEKGSIIEKLFILEELPEIKGATVVLQDSRPILSAHFELIYPKHLQFKTKSYNGLATMTEVKEAYKDKNSLSVSAFNLAAIPSDEKYANEKAHTKSLRYKLDSNLNSNAKNLNNYKEFATNVFENLNAELDSKMTKELDAFIKKIPASKDPFTQIRLIEQFIKTNIAYNRYYSENSNFTAALKSKQANEIEMLKLYTAVLKHFNIEHQFVVTSMRFKMFFDKDFDTIEQLTDIIFYFPTLKQYLEPCAFEYRFPLFNFNLGNNYGLFIKAKEFGGVIMGLGEIKFIDIPGGDITHDFTDITIDLTEDINNPEINTTHKQGGYAAAGLQYIKDFVSADQYQDIIKNISENYTQKAETKSIKIENDGCDNIGLLPFILNVTFEGKDLVQKAGDNLLLNVGVLIGKQMELYQVDNRVLPVELYYPHRYTRTIKVLLPPGYTIKNPEAFEMNYETIIDDKKVAHWHSAATLNGSELIVKNTENYDIIDCPLSAFESYKKVENAAADFNKIVVVISKM
ncbi:MAG TPA: DUF3857 domain-containing protein [Saprospiraceae bacterium]|nr:DUF3857 domain-containing protein [Saprospiraceae bacterium]